MANTISDKIYIICTSGTREKLQMASMTALVAAASGDMVTVFFSMNAITHFVNGNTSNVAIEGEFGNLLTNKGVPEFKYLFQQAVELGDAQLLPCSMAIDLMGIEESDLDSSFGTSTGLTKFLSDAKDGQLLSF